MANVIEEQGLLHVRFRIQGKEKQKIYFINREKNNEKVKVPYYGMWELP